MLAELLVPPTTPQEWQIWSFHHRENHDAIRAAIRTQRSIDLAAYPLDPIPTDLTRWLEANQQSHNDMNGALGTQSSDIGELKLDDPTALRAWIYSHYQEHLTANEALKI